MSTRLVIADDHPIVRSGIRAELAHWPEFEVIGEAINGDETLQLVKDLKPDILLLDVNMPGKKAIEVVQELKQQMYPCKILILSAYNDIPTIIGMLKAGVNGYILKDDDPTFLLDAMHAVLNEDTWLSLSVSDRLSAILGMQHREIGKNELTRREVEILLQAAIGKTNREIASALHLTERTVEFHMSNVLKKMDANGRLEAVMKAKERGII